MPVAVGQNICAPSCAVRSYCIERTPHDQNEALLYGCVWFQSFAFALIQVSCAQHCFPCGHELARKSEGGGTWTGGYRGAGQVIFHDYGARKGPASPRLPFAANNFVIEAKDSRMPVPAVGDSSVAVWGRLLSFWPPSFILRSYPALRPCVQSFFFLEF
jgi:hypothetical protein